MSVLGRIGEWLAVHGWYDADAQMEKEQRTEVARQTAIASRKTTEWARAAIREAKLEHVRVGAARAARRVSGR